MKEYRAAYRELFGRKEIVIGGDDVAFAIIRCNRETSLVVEIEIDKDMDKKSLIEPQVQEVGNLLKGQTAWESNQRGRVYDANGLSPTLNTHTGGGFEPKFMEGHYRIRKLTERECFRLMDVDEKDIDTIQEAGISRTQQYKMAGNSIVVSCLFHLFRKLFIEPENEYPEQTLW